MTISTASDWDNCRDPKVMLLFLDSYPQRVWKNNLPDPIPSLRKVRLFVFAMAAKARGINVARNGYGRWGHGESDVADPEDDNLSPIRNARSWIQSPEVSITADDQANILRDMICNPFRPVTLISGDGELDVSRHANPNNHILLIGEWLTPQVVSLAQAAYQKRDRECSHCHGRKKIMYDSIDDTANRMPSYFTDMTEPSLEYRVGYKQEYKDCHVCDGTGNGANNSSLDPIRLLILADALEEAGCESIVCEVCKGRKGDYVDIQDDLHLGWVECESCHGTGHLTHPILSHLRSPGPHYRGCWAADTLLGYK